MIAFPNFFKLCHNNGVPAPLGMEKKNLNLQENLYD